MSCGALHLFIVGGTAFTVKSTAFQTGLTNTTQTADCMLQIQVVSAFTLTETLGTRHKQWHVSLGFFLLMGSKAVSAK